MINLAGLQGERIYEGEKRLAISAKTPRARTAKGRREKEKRRHACRAERRQFTHVSAASKAEQLNETARQGWREELKKKKKRERPECAAGKKRSEQDPPILPPPPYPYHRVRFAKINAGLERNRERFNRAYFCGRRCRLRTLKRKTHRTAPSRPGEKERERKRARNDFG